MFVLTQAICSSTFWAPRATRKTRARDRRTASPVAGKPQPVPRQQDPAGLRLLDDPDVVVEGLLDGRAVGLRRVTTSKPSARRALGNSRRPRLRSTKTAGGCSGGCRLWRVEGTDELDHILGRHPE